MTQTAVNEELETAIAAAELTEDEAGRVRELVTGGGQAGPAIEHVLSERDDAEPEPEPPAPIEPPTEEPTKKQLQTLIAEQDRHFKRVHEVMGAHVAGFEPCEACGGHGLVEPGPPAPTPQPHEWFRACETCAGFGQVVTGSLRNGQEARDCPACKGRGYLEALTDGGAPLADQASAIAVAPSTPEPPPAPAAPAGGSGELVFGTPAWMGDPNLNG